MDPVAQIPAWLKLLQLLAVVFFFAGTMHIVRLLVAHRAALARWEPDRTVLAKEFHVLERRALYYLNWPALIAILLLGAWMLFKAPGLLKLPFVQAGIGLIALVVVYHFSVHRTHARLGKGTLGWSTWQLRVWSQGATLLLLALIVFALMRDRLNWVWGLGGLIVVGALVAYVGGSARKRDLGAPDAGTGDRSAGDRPA